jgi:acetoin utilization protein AcuB
LNCSDTGQKAINIMDSFRVSHLPLVRDGEYLGLISDDDVYDLEMEMCNIGENIASFKNPFIRVNQHVFEVVQKIMETKVTVLPVLEMDDEYYGSITINDLALYLTELVAAKETGAIIVLELNPIDYSLSQIAQIVESNDAKVISLYTKSQENTKEMDVTLKVNVTDVSSIIQTFVRYDYNIKAVYMDDSLLTDMYSERYELFMKYMDI